MPLPPPCRALPGLPCPAGVSNVMAAHMISIGGKEYNDDWSYREQAGEGGARPKRVLYSYFTAGKCCGRYG
jgi:hypothetical protein